MRIDLNLLATFLTVAELGSFTKAGRHLNATQSTVSHKVARLEHQLGCRLVTRSRRLLQLTESGERVLHYARRIEGLKGDLLADLGDAAVSGEVTLSIPEDLVASGFAAMIKLFKRRRPSITLRVQVGLSQHQRAWMDAGETDVGIIRHTAGTESADLLWVEPIIWVASDSVARDIARGDTAVLPFVHVPAPCLYRDAAMKAMADQGIRWETVMTCPHVEGIRCAVMANLGITAVAASAAPPGARRLGPRDGLPDLPECRLSLHTGSDTLRPATIALCDAIRRYNWKADVGRAAAPS